jgi:hypothetical protein
MKTSILMLLSALALFGAPAPAKDEILNRMRQYDQLRQSSLPRYTWMSQYTLDNKERHAEMMVLWTRERDGSKHYSVLYERGDGAVRSHVFHKLLESEVEASQPAVQSRNRLNDQNYDFQLTGSEQINGRWAYVFEIEPKIDSKFLVSGRIWVDATDYAVVQVEGRPAKRPSFWTKSVSFVQTFEKTGDYWMAAANRSVTDAKLFGEADLVIKHSSYSFQAAVMMAAN